MDDLCLRLPPLVQLEWCSEGFAHFPWFSSLETGRRIRLMADRPLSYVDPVACTMLAAWAHHRAALSSPVVIDDSAKSPYAWRIGLLSALAGHFKGVDTATERLLQITNLSSEAQIQPFLSKIRGLLHLDSETSVALAYCLSELLRNVFEHSGSRSGAFVAASYFSKTDRVTISVADLGVTVPVHIKRQFSPDRPLEEAAALRVALEPRASGSYDRKRNAGLGLYMTRRIADLTGGKFWLMSGGLCARNDGDSGALGGRGEVTLSGIANRWEGTVVALTLYPGRIRQGSVGDAVSTARAELDGGVAALLPETIFRKKDTLPGSVLIDVPPDASNIAQDKIAAAHLRENVIMAALSEGKSLTLNFAGVALTTQSFMHALLAGPLENIGRDKLASRLCFRACSTQVREIVRMVIGYVFRG
jgi:anti-sigma regulatory factor (Ser/Thr protein kinase)